MKRRILICDIKISGHRIEYIHHLLTKANLSNDEYVFYLPEAFIKQKDCGLDWSHKNNVKFEFFSPPKIRFTFAESVSISRLLRSAIIKYGISHVFLISLIEVVPFADVFIPPQVKVSGVIYNIYLYRWRDSSIIRRISDIVKYLAIVKSKCINRVYILNDEAAARYLNIKFRTEKFHYLPDPYVPINYNNKKSEWLTKELIGKSYVFYHFGSLSERKGTLEILNAIPLINKELREQSIFIFTGQVQTKIKNAFYSAVAECRHLAKIVVIDKFCDFDLIAEICSHASLLLIPYKKTSQSSGIIGYAGQFNVPVLAPSDGLIGKLVRRYSLGYTINPVTAHKIAEFINQYKPGADIPTLYQRNNTVQNFIDKIEFNY